VSFLIITPADVKLYITVDIEGPALIPIDRESAYLRQEILKKFGVT